MIPFASLCALSACCGVFAHLSFFIRGEWHIHAPLLTVCLASLPFTIWAAAFGSLPHERNLSFLKSLALAVVFSTSLFASILTYRLLFHPLSRFPGPLLARCTKLWHTYKCLGSQNHIVMEQLHCQYGDYVRTGPNEITIFTSEGSGIDAWTGACTKSAWYDFTLPELPLVSIRSKPLHDARRKVWLKGTTQKSVSQYWHYVKSHCAKVVETFESAADQGTPVDVVKYAYLYAFDCIGEIAMSKSFDMLADGDWNPVVVMLRSAMRILGPMTPVPWLAHVGFALFGWLPIIRNFRQMKQWCISRMEERREDDRSHFDLATIFIQADRSQMGLRILHGDTFAAIAAGSDTTASTLVFCLYHLALDPDIQRKLSRELVDQVSLDFEDLQACKYLDAFIWEVLRLHPAVPTGGLRNTPEKGLRLQSGMFIPGNVTISFPKYVISRSPKFFLQPKNCIPERWTSRPELVVDRSAHIPFGAHRYACPGMGIALMEIRSVLAATVSRFDVCFADEPNACLVEREMKDLFTAEPGPLSLTFRHKAAK